MKKTFVALFIFCSMSISAYAEVIQFDINNSIKIGIPSGWGTTRLTGTLLPEMGSAFDVRFNSPVNEKASLTVTTGKTQTGKPLTKKQFDSLTKTITTKYLNGSAEKKAVFNTLPISGGQGKYSIFTNVSLVDATTQAPLDYKYAVLFLVNYDNGCFVYATGLADDRSGDDFQNMVKSISSIEPSLAAIIRTSPVKIKTNKQGVSIGNTVSKTTLLIPSQSLKVVKERSGGGQSSPGYFAFMDTKSTLVLSGWLEPVKKFAYNDISELWALMSSKSPLDMLNTESKKIGDWEIFLFDLPLPIKTVSNVQMQASLLCEDVWINLHISITANKPSEALRDALVEYLKTIQIITSK